MAQLPSKQLCPLCGLDDEVKAIGIRGGKGLLLARAMTTYPMTSDVRIRYEQKLGSARPTRRRRGHSSTAAPGRRALTV